MNVSITKVILSILHRANTTSWPLTLSDVAYIRQCENAMHMVIDLGQEEEERGREGERRRGGDLSLIHI